MFKKLLILVSISIPFATGCRYFRSEATLQIQALNGEGEALANAKVLVDKTQVGTTDAHGFFKTSLDLPNDEPLLVEVSKPSTETFYAPFFETIKVKRGDLNVFKLKATLYGVKQGSSPLEALASAAPVDAALHEKSTNEATQILEISPEAALPTESPTLATATDATDASVAHVTADKGRPLTFYVVSGREAVENASVYFGDPAKKQWMHGCYSNNNGRCSFQIPERMDAAVILVRAKGFQTQSRSFQLYDGDKVRFELNRGRSLEIFAINPNQGLMEGVAGVEVSLNGKSIGKTDVFGSFVAPLASDDELNGKVSLSANDWLPAKAEFTLSATANESIIQHFQSIKPSSPKIALMDFIVYREKNENGSAPLLTAPSTDSIQTALATAGGMVINGAALNGKLAEQKISLNDLSGATWGQLKKVGESIQYVVRPSFVEGAQARIILSAIDPVGHMVFSASQNVKAKGSTQAVLNDLSMKLMQSIRHEGAVVEAIDDTFRINLGKVHGLQAGDKIQITGNVRLPSGEITAWDTIASASVTEVGAERSRIKLIQSQPNARVEAGNSITLDRRTSSSGETFAVQVLEEKSEGPIGLAEVYSGDNWLGASDLSGQALVSAVDLVKTKELSVFSPGFTPKAATLAASDTGAKVSLSHEATAVQIESQPSGALVKINGRDLGRTPIDTDIPYPGATVNIEIGGVDGFEYITRAQSVSSRGIVLRGNTQITLNRDPLQAAKVLASEGKLVDAAQLLEGIPETDSTFLLAQHQLGELYLNQLHDPVKAASAFHKVTSSPNVESYKDKRFIGTFINEAVALYQAGEQAASSDSNLAISYWRHTEAILSQTEEQLRYVPQAQYNQAVHTLSYYRALSLHKTWTITQNAEDQEHAMQYWKDYIQGTALALPQDQHYDWVKKAEGYFKLIQTARVKPRTDIRSPKAM